MIRGNHLKGCQIWQSIFWLAEPFFISLVLNLLCLNNPQL